MTMREHRDGVTLRIDGAAVGTALRSPVAGRFLRRHPLRADVLARPGQAVSAGATIGLIAVGPVLVPVTVPADGLVLSLAVVDGGAVGYGENLAVVVPLAELAAMGIEA